MDSLKAYTGPLSAARLALLMFYAFRISKYWPKPENWYSLDMENFLGASRKLDLEFRKWRQHDALVKKFPTVDSVLMEIAPFPLVVKATELGLVGHVGSGATLEWFVGTSYEDAICKAKTKAEVTHDAVYYPENRAKLEAAIEQASASLLTVKQAFEIEE